MLSTTSRPAESAGLDVVWAGRGCCPEREAAAAAGPATARARCGEVRERMTCARRTGESFAQALTRCEVP